MINKEKWDKLSDLMVQLHINEADLIEKFIIGSGKGGQKLHKTASTVYLKHMPSGLEIKCQESRSREDNRYFARMRLCDKVQSIVSNEKTKEQQKIEKLKRQKKRRSRRAKQKILDEKARQSDIKVLRKKPSSFE
ncbi:peptide chain release factor-like protein [Fluoribacter gormanii]|uniref:Peptide chain release factor 1 n=1 Tax=Fluoribacter gormanii TaxID=464 RepID=A0A377GL85_9GAMM|nr:peptide chain release factor-like protein [Fluoribacter gormanii]KTD01855.1 peptide chain release factor [Fluoribacter gormanii]MCW8443024.1 peptide chain release factor-like protein [Fluoribacter gormanii]MCW8471515.1 peptide chain release factor-like protein [Fluoribacter gormanii]SIR23207.1 RF-1 domain-containing protein [Fluoribacter gormanii]STO25374.1 Peptide chain release factor 1 [Fluoribacter gormanii]